MKMYRVRAHHGMCLAYYRGKGYSNEFAAHMWRMKQQLEKNPIVILQSQADSICEACPHNREGVCTSDNKAADYDRQVLSSLGLHQGDTIRWLEFTRLVDKYILETGRREEICGECQWNHLCRQKTNS